MNALVTLFLLIFNWPDCDFSIGVSTNEYIIEASSAKPHFAMDGERYTAIGYGPITTYTVYSVKYRGAPKVTTFLAYVIIRLRMDKKPIDLMELWNDLDPYSKK